MNPLDVISRVFPSKFQQIVITSVSCHWMHILFKLFQYILWSLISQFHEFFLISFLAGFYNLVQPNFVAAASPFVFFLSFPSVDLSASGPTKPSCWDLFMIATILQCIAKQYILFPSSSSSLHMPPLEPKSF